MYTPDKAWFNMNIFTPEPGETCCVCGKEIRLVGKGHRVQFRGCPNWDRHGAGICSECYALGNTSAMLKVLMVEATYANIKPKKKPEAPKKKIVVGAPAREFARDIWATTTEVSSAQQFALLNYSYGLAAPAEEMRAPTQEELQRERERILSQRQALVRAMAEPNYVVSNPSSYTINQDGSVTITTDYSGIGNAALNT